MQTAEDVLSFTPAGGISGGYDAPSGTLSLSGVATLANYQTVLRSVKYNNSSENPSNVNRTISITVNDGTSPSNSLNKTVTVTPVNDPPVVSNIANQTVAEGTSFGPITLDNYVTDPDNADNQLIWSYSGNTDLTVSIISRVATITPPTPDWNGAETITFTATDPSLASGSDPATFTVTPVNDPPVLDNIEVSALTYTEGSPAVAITNTMTATDIDNTNLASAVISISSNYASDQDQLTFVNANNITGSWNALNGTMTLSGSSSVANYQSALRSVKYINNSPNPNTALRTITFTANDGVASSFPETRNISINATNNPPVLTDPSSTPINYTENGSPLQLTGTITVADDDNTQLASAMIDISSGYQIGQDTLIFTPTGGISGSFDRNNGTLNLSGTSLVANYQTALRSVRYANNSDNPVTSARTIAFTVYDGTDNSNNIIKTLTVTAVNDAPVLTETSVTPVNYTENAAPVQLTGTIAVTDADNTQLSGATISITSGFHTSEDTLSFTAGNGITGTYSTTTGILLLTGTSSLANYRTALRSVRYKNRSDNPTVTNRIVSFIVSDGSAPTSNTINKTSDHHGRK